MWPDIYLARGLKKSRSATANGHQRQEVCVRAACESHNAGMLGRAAAKLVQACLGPTASAPVRRATHAHAPARALTRAAAPQPTPPHGDRRRRGGCGKRRMVRRDLTGGGTEQSSAVQAEPEQPRGRSHFMSPSSSERWLTCTRSWRFEEQFPVEPSSPYAAEGTFAHEVVRDARCTHICTHTHTLVGA